MSVSITTVPSYPAPGRIVTISFSPSGGGNWVKVFITDAPPGSDLKAKLAKTGATRELVYEGDSSKPWGFTPDSAGVYSLSIEEYTKGASLSGGGYQDATATYQTETVISTSSVSLRIGQRLIQQIGTGKDTATLVLFVHNDTIRETTADIQGFVSPEIVEPRSELAEAASLNSGVRTALAALKNVTASAALGTLESIVDNIIIKYENHRADAASHSTADTDNPVAPAFKNPAAPGGLKASLAEIARQMDEHMRNDDGGSTAGPGGTGTKSYHVVGGLNRADWVNLPLIKAAGEQFEVIAQIADLWRAYEGHRVSAVHAAPDTTNTLTALPTLLNLHRLFLAELAKTSPTAPAVVNSGAVVLAAGAGFKEENL